MEERKIEGSHRGKLGDHLRRGGAGQRGKKNPDGT